MAGGSYSLSEAPERLVIICDECTGRRGEYGRAKALEQYGDISLPDFLAQAAKARCARGNDVSSTRPCQAHFSADTIAALPKRG